MPSVRLGVGIGAGEQDPEPGDVREGRPDLLAVDDVLVAVALGTGRERREVAAGSGLAEQLAPDLGAVEDPGEVAVLLLLGARDEERRAGPADADRVQRARDRERRGAPRRSRAAATGPASSPQGAGQWGATYPAAARRTFQSGGKRPSGACSRDESPDLVAVGLRLCREIEVHRARLPAISLPPCGDLLPPPAAADPRVARGSNK